MHPILSFSLTVTFNFINFKQVFRNLKKYKFGIVGNYVNKNLNRYGIIDHKKNSGWIHVSQLKKVNSVIALGDKIMFKKPTVFSEPIAKILKGRLLVIQKCEDKWCKVQTQDFKGWVDKDNLWGAFN